MGDRLWPKLVFCVWAKKNKTKERKTQTLTRKNRKHKTEHETNMTKEKNTSKQDDRGGTNNIVRVVGVKTSPTKGGRRFHKNTAYARSGFRVQGLGFRVQGSGFRVQGFGFRV